MKRSKRNEISYYWKNYKKLPHQELQVVRAVIMENKKYKEAAEELHISVNTLKTHLTRDIETIKKRIQSAFTVLLKLNFSSFSVTHLLIWTLFY